MALLNNLLRHRKNPMLQSLGAYTFTNFFGKGVAFLLLPYFTYKLQRSDMGLLSLFSGAIIFLVPFVSMGVLQSVNAEFFKLDKKSFKDLFTTSLLLPFVVSLLSFIFFFVFGNALQEKYHFPPSFLWLIPTVTFLTFIGEHLIIMIRNNNLPRLFMKVVLGRLLLEVAIAVVLISVIQLGWQGRTTGILISYILMTIFAFYFYISRGYLFGKIKKNILREELVYSVPVIILQASVFCLSSSDNFFLSRFTHDNNAEVGIYAIACTFGSVILTLSSALLQFVIPKIYGLLSQPVINYSAIRKFFFLYAGIMLAGLLLLICAVPLAYKYIIHISYRPGIKYYYLLCTGYFFWAIAYFFYSFLLYHKNKKKLLWLSLSSIAISLTSNYFFIKNMGAMGAAISVCCAYFTVLMITLLFTYKELNFIFFKINMPAKR